jgi:oxygen-independent coproporphyrinogen-3 oxidase
VHLYLHIPFCKQACHYCDFHFSTSLKNKEDMVNAFVKEIGLRKGELPQVPLETIYFGGGTPSVLSDSDLGKIFEGINAHFDIRNDAEITLEANPDDLTAAKIKELRNSPVNRLSIGIQSFRDSDLKVMNRAHNANEAERSVKASQDAGITNITADLIYALPDQSLNDWRENIHKLIALDIPHLSSYCLTVEPNTALAKLVREGKIKSVPDQTASDHFKVLTEETAKAGFEHYEISNFAKEGFVAVHNSSYWKGEPYLGVGPSAHSFNGTTRRWNVSHNINYLKAIHEGKSAYQEEVLSTNERYNEFVMTGLRTKWGVNIDRVGELFGSDFKKHLLSSAESHISGGRMTRNSNTLTLTSDGKFLADGIASDLFIVRSDSDSHH